MPIMGTFGICEWSVHHIMREEVGAPLGVAAPLSYIQRGGGPLSHTLLKRPFGWSLLPPLAGPPHEQWLKRSSAQKVFSTTTTTPQCCWSSRGIHYFRCPAGTRDRRSSSSRTCDRVRKCCPFAALIFTTLRLASDRLHQPRETFSLTKLSVCEGESFQNRYQYLLDLILACLWLQPQENFCFLCNEPFSGIRARFMRRCFVRLEHIWMWALMIMLLHTFVYFGSWWHSGIEAARTNFTCPCT